MTTMPPKPPLKTNYNRGDVVLVLFPNSDLRTAKTRPAIVVQADNLQTKLPQVIVAIVSSKVMRANHPARVLISITTPEGRQSGLLVDSVVMTGNLATVALASVSRVVGSLPMRDIDTALRHTLGLA